MLEIDDFTQLADLSYMYKGDPGEPGYAWESQRRSTTPEENAILAFLAIDLFVLEIGTGLGISTEAMAKAGATVFTVDLDPWVHEHIWPRLDRYPDVHCYDEVPDDRHSAYDMVFIDGNHMYDAVKKDIEVARQLQIPRIVLHDVDVEDVRRAVTDAGGTVYQIGKTRLGLAVFPPPEVPV